MRETTKCVPDTAPREAGHKPAASSAVHIIDYLMKGESGARGGGEQGPELWMGLRAPLLLWWASAGGQWRWVEDKDQCLSVLPVGGGSHCATLQGCIWVLQLPPALSLRTIPGPNVSHGRPSGNISL